MSSIWHGKFCYAELCCFCLIFACFKIKGSGLELFPPLNYAVVLQEFTPEPVIPIYNARPEQVEKALKHVYHASMNKTKGKELELLLAILPDNNGSLYGMSFMPVVWCLLD